MKVGVESPGITAPPPPDNAPERRAASTWLGCRARSFARSIQVHLQCPPDRWPLAPFREQIPFFRQDPSSTGLSPR
ncbi:hypothetical protein HPB50_014876 [Hyalomma asiaticum]|uniref:Uncharacterized protein n=1 Tax=Hyalomma asiaticum TaxID=266040 RepID=A0ACB7SLA1_HYAAI|nr:hypothetical protein HPB50_014876 [Hyalomma asiaticum]